MQPSACSYSLTLFRPEYRSPISPEPNANFLAMLPKGSCWGRFSIRYHNQQLHIHFHTLALIVPCFLLFFPSFATRQSYWKISFPNHNSPTRDCSIRLAHCSGEPLAITLHRLPSAIKNEKPSSLSVEISFRLANSGGTTLQARGRGGMGDKN